MLKSNDINIAVINNREILITDTQSALDLMAKVQYETGCDRIVLNQSTLDEDFFHLKTKLARDILQKFINYHVKIAIVGEFSTYTSRNFQAFIYECNQGKEISDVQVCCQWI